MPREECLVVWDCGATNTTVSLLAADGRFLGTNSAPTRVKRTKEGLVWPFEQMWNTFSQLTRDLLEEIPAEPMAVVVSTFGVCWGPLDADGDLVAPVISWKCTRTREQLAWAEENLDVRHMYVQTGAAPFYFNTVFSLAWMQEHHPEVLKNAYTYQFMPQLFTQRLSGAFCVERTMATTAMLLDLNTGDWSSEIFEAFSIPNKFPSEMVGPGDVIGEVTEQASRATGLPKGTRVVAGGHDTVLATAGAGRDLRRTALYSTGTWGLLVVTRDEYTPQPEDMDRNIVWQLNPHTEGIIGGYNTQGHMIGGLTFDLLRKAFAPRIKVADITERCVNVPPGSEGVIVIPTFVKGTGPTPKAPGSIIGYESGMAPEVPARAALEGLAFQTRDALSALEADVDSILIGGGFAKNHLFGEILANVTGMTVEMAGIPEVTTLGAGALAKVGTGLTKSIEEAWQQVDMSTTSIEPGEMDYEAAYQRYHKATEALSDL